MEERDRSAGRRRMCRTFPNRVCRKRDENRCTKRVESSLARILSSILVASRAVLLDSRTKWTSVIILKHKM